VVGVSGSGESCEKRGGPREVAKSHSDFFGCLVLSPASPRGCAHPARPGGAAACSRRNACTPPSDQRPQHTRLHMPGLFRSIPPFPLITFIPHRVLCPKISTTAIPNDDIEVRSTHFWTTHQIQVIALLSPSHATNAAYADTVFTPNYKSSATGRGYSNCALISQSGAQMVCRSARLADP